MGQKQSGTSKGPKTNNSIACGTTKQNSRPASSALSSNTGSSLPRRTAARSHKLSPKTYSAVAHLVTNPSDPKGIFPAGKIRDAYKIAAGYLTRSELKEAEELYREILFCCQSYYKPDENYTSHVYDSLGRCLYHQKKFPDSLANLNKAFEIRKKNYPNDPTHKDWGQSYYSFAQYYYHAKEYEKCKDNALKAIDVFEKASSPDDPLIGDLMVSVAHYYNIKQDVEMAIEWYRKAEDIYLKNQNKDMQKISVVQTGLGHMYKKIKNYDVAIACLRDALETVKEHRQSGRYHYLYVNVMGCLGDCFLDVGDYGEAAEHFHYAWTKAQALYGDNYNDTRYYKQQYEKAKKQTGATVKDYKEDPAQQFAKPQGMEYAKNIM